jgi:multicomponent Na+:H+ antiporter subunit E
MFSHIMRVVLLAFVPAVIWMILTQQVNGEGFLLGYIIGIALTALLVRRNNNSFDPVKLPSQFAATLVYIVLLFWDIFVSGIDVFLRIIGRRPVNPGIARVALGDPRESVAAISAHGITVTPGQLVVDFDDQNHLLFVHCLDIEDADNILHSQQVRRLALIKRILE